MDKFFKIVGIIVVLYLAFSLIGWLAGFLIKGFFWVAIVAGIAYIVASIVAKKSRT